MKASRDNSVSVVSNTAVMDTPSANSWLITPRTNSSKSSKIEPKTRSRQMHDIESLLALPLHTVPAPSVLSQTLVRNRLLALPRQRRKVKHKKEDQDGIGRDMKLKQKING